MTSFSIGRLRGPWALRTQARSCREENQGEVSKPEIAKGNRKQSQQHHGGHAKRRPAIGEAINQEHPCCNEMVDEETEGTQAARISIGQIPRDPSHHTEANQTGAGCRTA